MNERPEINKARRPGFSAPLLLVIVALSALLIPRVSLNSSYLEQRIKLINNYALLSLPERDSPLLAERAGERNFSVMDGAAALLAIYNLSGSTAGLGMDDFLLFNERAANRQSLIERLMELDYEIYERSHFGYRMIIFSDGQYAFYIPVLDGSTDWNRSNYILNIGTDGLDYWNDLISNLE